MTQELKKEIEVYIQSIGGNEADIEQITEEIEILKYTTMEEVKAHIENYYL